MEVYAKPLKLQSIGQRTVLKLYMGRGGWVKSSFFTEGSQQLIIKLLSQETM